MRKLLVLALPILFVAYAVAQPCSNADVRGVYLFQTSGWTNTPDPAYAGQMVPMRGLGFGQYDGNGNASGQFTATMAGTPLQMEFVGLKYAINSDCTGTAQYQVKNLANGMTLGPQKHKLLVLEDGNLIRTLMTDSGGGGSIITGEIRRVSRGPRACDQSMIRGTYAMTYDGWANMQLLNPNQNYFAPVAGVGRTQIDAAGNATGLGTHNWSGLAVESQLANGVFNVNADCTGTFQGTANFITLGKTMPFKYPMVVTGDGAQFVTLGLGMDVLQSWVRISIP